MFIDADTVFVGINALVSGFVVNQIRIGIDMGMTSIDELGIVKRSHMCRRKNCDEKSIRDIFAIFHNKGSSFTPSLFLRFNTVSRYIEKNPVVTLLVGSSENSMVESRLLWRDMLANISPTQITSPPQMFNALLLANLRLIRACIYDSATPNISLIDYIALGRQLLAQSRTLKYDPENPFLPCMDLYNLMSAHMEAINMVYPHVQITTDVILVKSFPKDHIPRK